MLEIVAMQKILVGRTFILVILWQLNPCSIILWKSFNSNYLNASNQMNHFEKGSTIFNKCNAAPFKHPLMHCAVFDSQRILGQYFPCSFAIGGRFAIIQNGRINWKVFLCKKAYMDFDNCMVKIRNTQRSFSYRGVTEWVITALSLVAFKALR